MTRLINPDQQYFDNNTGAPLALGTVYFGEPNQDPETNPKAVYSNAALTAALSPTQTLTAAGKHSQPIFLDGAYSMTVRDAFGVLVWNEDYVASPDGFTQGGTVQDAISYVTPAMRGSLQAAITYAATNGALLVLNEVSYTSAAELTATGALSIYVARPCTITLTASAETLLAVTGGQLQIKGYPLTINTAGLDTKAQIYCNGYLPEIENVTFTSSAVYALLVANGKDGETPHTTLSNNAGYLKHCVLNNCANGWRVLGGANAESANFRYRGEYSFIGCEAKGTSGSSASGRLYFADYLKRVKEEKCTWTGNASTATNAYRCDEVIIDGSLYHDILRGPTVGKNCRNFKIVNNTCLRTSYSGIHVDLRDDAVTPETQEYPKGYGVVEGNTIRNCGYPMYVQGKNINITGNHIDTFTENTAIRVNGGADIWIDGNHIRGGTGKSVCEAANGSTVKIGENDHDATGTNAYQSIDGSASTFIFGNYATISGSGNVDVPGGVDTIYATATGAALSLRFPDMDTSNMFGKVWRVIQMGGSYAVNLSVRNGDGTISGVVTLGANDQYRSIYVTATGFKAYIGEASHKSSLYGSASYNPPPVAAGSSTSTTVTVTGATLGDFADASFSLALAGLRLSAYVSAADTVTCEFANPTGGSIDLGSGTLRVKVDKQPG